MSEQLKPCPFCGATKESGLVNICIAPVESFLKRETIEFYTVKCGCCEAQIGNHCTEDGAIAAWNRRASSWISVEDRLPEVNKEVLVYCRFYGEKMIGVSYIDENDRWLFGDITYYWMPLSKPPEVKE